MKDLKIGLIGSGGRVNVLQFGHKAEENVRITACCDIREDAFVKNKDTYSNGIFTTVGYSELLNQDLDAVAVGTPDYLHE